MNAAAKHIENSIFEKQNKERALWLENYVKHNIKSLGVGIPEIREIVIKTNHQFGIIKLSLPEQINFLNHLIQQPYTEYKLATILYIQLFWSNMPSLAVLELMSEWFDNKWINDWNVCDWLCVRIISPLLDTASGPVINELTQWNNNAYLWKARASLVPFAQCKSIKNHIVQITEFSEKLIKREERFCKTAVGWVLREYSKIDATYVSDFLVQYNNWTTKEVIRNATKYFSK